jgi:glycine betaine/proline transport system substrate-binding protein
VEGRGFESHWTKTLAPDELSSGPALLAGMIEAIVSVVGILVAVIATIYLPIAKERRWLPFSSKSADTSATANKASPRETPLGEGKTIRPARATWETGCFQVEIYIKALEGLGYDVQSLKTMENSEFYDSVGRGVVDFWANGWFPMHSEDYEHVRHNAAIAGTVAANGAVRGYLIDKKTAEEYNISNLADFQDPTIRSLFDLDGDGKAEMAACPPGWSCYEIIQHQLNAYRLGNFIRPVTSGYRAVIEDSLSLYYSGKPILLYTWTPSWVIGKLIPGIDLVWLEVPFTSLPEGEMRTGYSTVAFGLMGCTNDPCNLGFPVNDINVVANRDFLRKNPAVAKLFQVMSIPMIDISIQNAKLFAGENSTEDIRRHVDQWIEGNRELFSGWIDRAKQGS